jgi:hypothetical protein
MELQVVTTLVEVVGRNMVQLSQLALTGYVVRQVSVGTFTYLNRRLEVLGKDAFVFYPREKYQETTVDADPMRIPRSTINVEVAR